MADGTARPGTGSGSVSGSGACVRLIVVFTMAGGLFGGGGVIALIGFLRPDVTYLILGLVPPLFVLGALAGFGHGAALAWLGRPDRLSGRAYAGELMRGGLCCIPGLGVAAVIAFWIAYTTALLNAGRTLWTVAVALGWVAAVAVFWWAGSEGLKAARIAFRRWPERRLGMVLIAGTFLGTFALLPRREFEVRGADLRLSTLGVVFLALALTLWVAAPIEALVLRAVRRRPGKGSPALQDPSNSPTRSLLRGTMNPRKIATLFGLSIFLGVMVSCTETKEVFVDLPDYEDPPTGAAGFLGYTNSESRTPVCGNCHVGQFGEWRLTAHASAWEDLQASGHASETCEGCHTVSPNGNEVSSALAGWTATQDDRYHDVQCESCHGPGLAHVTNPDNDVNKPLASLVVGADGSSACGECHQGIHNPFVEEWSISRHGTSTENHAAENASCGPCHEGRGIFAAWGVRANYLQKEETEPIAIGCPICHDPHDATNSKQLRFPINVANVETNLCMKCHHRRSEPDPSSSRGPHSPQGPLLVGEAVGWKPPNFTYTDRISGTHGSAANTRLCAACHVSRTEVIDAASGNLLFNSTGHLFKAIACLDAQGIPTTDDSCGLAQRNFSACSTSGCHGSQDAARSALIAVRSRFDLLTSTLDDLLAQVPGTEFVTGDNLITTAEGAKFNSNLAKLGGSGAHNPFLVEALLTASIKQVKTDYGLQPPVGLNLENIFSEQH